MPLFDKVCYHISDSIPEHTRRELGRILEANGAAEGTLDRATHVVSDTVDFEGASMLKKDVACVTPYWVERSMELGTQQDPKYFSADKEMIFSGIVATSAGIPPGDKEVMIAGIKESGGQWREGLTRDVTHLFATNTSSQKYETAMHFRDTAHITILLPQWFDQCWSMQMRLPHTVFEFPDPPYMRNDHDVASYKAQISMNRDTEEGLDKRAMFRSLKNMDLSSPVHASTTPVRNVWQTRAILLSASLGLDVRLRQSVEARIRRNGGTVVVADDGDSDETGAVERADVLVTQYRTGSAYAHALATGRIIGTLAWLFFVERSGVVSSPRNHLLHYPVRNWPIEGFQHHEITVTNYQGDERDYLKKLIELMGAKFTPTMSGRNTIVIAAYKGGNKTAKAEEWSVPIVTHKWLEDCFVEWRNLTPAQKKYLDYAPGVNYGTVLGSRGVGRIGLEEDPDLEPEKDKSAPVKEDAGKAQQVDVDKPHETLVKMTSTVDPLAGTATSMHEAREVEEALDTRDGDIEYADDVPVDAAMAREEVQRQEVSTPTKEGPPRGVKRTPAKTDSTPKSTLRSTAKVPSVRGQNGDASPSTRKGKEKEKPPPPSSSEDEDNRESGDELPRVLRPSSRPRMGNTPKDKAKVGSPSKSPVTAELMLRAKLGSSKRLEPAFEEEPGANEKKPKHGHASRARVLRDDHETVSKPKPKPTPTGGKGEPINVDDSDAEIRKKVRETSPWLLSKSSPKTYRSKTKAKHKVPVHVSEPESDSSVQEIHPKKTHDRADSDRRGVTPSPRRIVSVKVPDARVKHRTFSRERGDSPSSPKPSGTSKSRPKFLSPLPRKSTRTTEDGFPSSSKARKGQLQPEKHEEEESPSPPPLPNRESVAEARMTTSGTSSLSSTPPPIQRTPSRRSAAAAASQKLRDEVMPDVINYEKEVKRGGHGSSGRKRKKTSNFDDEDGNDDSSDEARGKKNRKVSHQSSKGTNKDAKKGEESDRRPVKFVTHVRPAKRSPSTDREDRSRPSTPIVRAGARKRPRVLTPVSNAGSEDNINPRVSSCDPKKIRILTTKVTIRDEVSQRLTKLGVKFTEKPAQCTHLVASSFARTEKFLCALPNVPFILSTSWLLESSAKEMILAESDFLLRDPQMEEKHNFKLTEALDRARDLQKKKRKLLQGHFFYFTPKVSVDFNLIKNVIQTNGGECILRAPTVRNLSATRHVISSEQDAKLWRPLAKQGYPIYSTELILTAACAQLVDWDGENKRVPGSL